VENEMKQLIWVLSQAATHSQAGSNPASLPPCGLRFK